MTQLCVHLCVCDHTVVNGDTWNMIYPVSVKSETSVCVLMCVRDSETVGQNFIWWMINQGRGKELINGSLT